MRRHVWKILAIGALTAVVVWGCGWYVGVLVFLLDVSWFYGPKEWR